MEFGERLELWPAEKTQNSYREWGESFATLGDFTPHTSGPGPADTEANQ